MSAPIFPDILHEIPVRFFIFGSLNPHRQITMSKNTDILNVGLIIVSLSLAFVLPFELFLFSYAVLGPMHYLTEISWLRDKDYFVKTRTAVWVIVFFVALATIPILLRLSIFSEWHEITSVRRAARFIRHRYPEIVLGTFLFAIGLVHLKRRLHLAIFLIASVVAAHLMLRHVPGVLIVTAVFLPTVIHVYLFTMFFMIFGTLQSGSKSGVFAIIALIIAPFIIFFSTIDAQTYEVGGYATGTFTTLGFGNIHKQFHAFFNPGQQASFSYLSVLGIKTQIFLAFAYTYHYLNWFSKTTVIGWHRNLSHKKIAVVLAIWVMCISLYAYDYRTGMIALTFLSLLHVILEFPLNITCIKAIFSNIRMRFA